MAKRAAQPRSVDSPTAAGAPLGLATSATSALLAWYDRHRRDLPWRAPPRERPDPYGVWLSEIMLQQTTVAAVKPYFLAFLARWPDIAALAEAPLDAVMRQWAGLGYYSRARNLHACAKAIVAEHDGRFPSSETALARLPGIGPYTAAAIAAIAFGAQVAVVDGNVERVIARLCALETPLPAAKSLIRAKTAALVPEDRPGDFAQAMMDLGATLCSPRHPACGLCPLRGFCHAARQGSAERFPLKAPRPARPHREGAVFYIRCGDAVLLRNRPLRGLLGGMAEFPGTDWSSDGDRDTTLDKLLREAPIIADYGALTQSVRHVFTHFSLRLAIFVAQVEARAAPQGCRWVKESTLIDEALPSVMRKVVAAIKDSGW